MNSWAPRRTHARDPWTASDEGDAIMSSILTVLCVGYREQGRREER